MAQHKWHEEIKAWADGAVIEFLTEDGWLDAGDPEWNEDSEYRIKPQPKQPRPLYVIMFDGDIDKIRLSQYVRLNENEFVAGKIRLENDDD
jgi:hypothetical protein